MPELLLELFSEEIPARMQARAADDLARLVTEALAPLAPAAVRSYAGPRRIALVAQVAAEVPAARVSERGPRVSAPEQALAGFLRKHRAAREQLVPAGDYWLLERETPTQDAASLVAAALPPLLWRFPWPKSMRWGAGSAFTWVRPLRRILCILDGEVVPFALRQGEDDAHGLRSGNATEGHRFHAPGAFVVQSAIQWRERLRERRVIVDAAERRHVIETGLREAAAARGLSVVEDAALLDEVAGLVEWPKVLVGGIDPAFMDLLPEVMQVSMRVNQKYFALRDGDGQPAPFFAFAANLEAADGGKAIVAGNERVLRARFADARHFWDLDRRQTLASRVPLLDRVTFHAKLGSQGDRTRRLVKLANDIAPLVGADVEQARRAAELCKADLVTGMVGEFPELQGVMGGYYARHDNELDQVAAAIRDHYAPKGATDNVPTGLVSIAVAIADKLDQLVLLFAIGDRPTGSADPLGLRRAAIGLIRIIIENKLRVDLFGVIDRFTLNNSSDYSMMPNVLDRYMTHRLSLADDVIEFIVERLIVQLRYQGVRPDVIQAIAISPYIRSGRLPRVGDGDLTRMVRRAAAVAAMLDSETGMNLLAGYRRAANILRIERHKDGRDHESLVDADRLAAPDERTLDRALQIAQASIAAALKVENYDGAIESLASLRGPIDAFFEKVTVNADDPALRANRLNLLAAIVRLMNTVADFSRIEG